VFRRAAGDGRPGLRALFGRTRQALSLVWTASPALTAAMALVTAVTAALPTSMAVLQRIVIDGLTVRQPHVGVVLPYAAGLAAAGLTTTVVPDIGAYAQNQLGRILALHTQGRLFAALNSFPGLARFESPQFMDRVELAKNAGQSSALGVVTNALSLAQWVISGGALSVALWLVSPALAVLVLAATGPGVILQFSLTHERASLQWRMSGRTRRQIFYGALQTDLHAVKEIRLFGIGDFLRTRMLSELGAINGAQRRLDRKTFIRQNSMAALSSAMTGAGVVWIVIQAAAGRVPIGDVSLFILAAAGVQAAVGSATTSLAGCYQSLLMFGHYTDIVTAEPDLPVAAEPREAPALRTGIEFRDVWFRYGQDMPWALRGVSLFIPAGQSVGLVGLNGAGKSTLVKLLCRLYDPEIGGIYWDGTDIRDLDLTTLRNRIGAIFQDYMAYDLTAAENVGLGDITRMTDLAMIKAAAELAGVDQVLAELPRGYETLLSRIFFDNADRDDLATGLVLSGGQWQRVALARGLMRADRDLLILDEPTSGLDAEGESAVHQRLRNARSGRASVLISHRLGTIKDADMIYVLAAGVIVESGRHAQLMAAEGEYHRLFCLQASAYQADGTGPDCRRPPTGASPVTAASSMMREAI
jgi:ATP-binding cassette, subfamily B, bacterial